MSGLFNRNFFDKERNFNNDIIKALNPASFQRVDGGDGSDITGAYVLSHADNTKIVIPLDLPDNATIMSVVINGSHYTNTTFRVWRTLIGSIGGDALSSGGFVNTSQLVSSFALIDNINYNYYVLVEDLDNVNYLFGGSVNYVIKEVL